MKNLLLASAFLFSLGAQAAPIVDFSEDAHPALVKLKPAEEKQILAQLFSKTVKDYADCAATESEGTEMILSDVQVAKGHFANDRDEDLVVVFKSVDCTGGHAGEHGNIALVRDLKVIHSTQDLGTETLYKAADADGDGLLDVITTASFSNMGYSGSWANTVTFKGDTAAALTYVNGTVHYDDCGLDGRTEGEYDAVFFADAKRAGVVNQKNYRKACGASRKSYKLYSKGVLDKEI